jgi:hypothetical protein
MSTLLRNNASRSLRLTGAALLGALTLCSASAASAFCGFFVSGADANLYNNASQVVLMRRGNHTALTMSNNYKGPPEDFAMVVPVPVVLKKEQVKTLSPAVFKSVDTMSAPRLVEYWERDPCYVPPPVLPMADVTYAPTMPSGAVRLEEASARNLGVKIEARFQEGEYQILILSAKDSSGLDTWLRLNKYKIPAGADAALAPYIREQMKFFVAKDDIKKVQRDPLGSVVLSPLRFSYDAQELRLPVRLGLLNAPSPSSGQDAAAKQDLIIYILNQDNRYEVANYANAFIPTNVEVTDSVKGQFGAFYAELFDETIRRSGGRAVVTEYAWRTPILQRPQPDMSWNSYHCDPCPAPETPPPSLSDWVSLGDKEILGPLAEPVPGGLSRDFQLPSGLKEQWVLTRLHTRYDKNMLSEDLIFRAARPVSGGLANSDGTNTDQGAKLLPSDGTDRFQGRYIIRHYWEGPVRCKSPQYGVWTGPPGGGGAQTARDLASTPRGKLSLPAIVRSAIPSLEIKGTQRPLRPGEKR